MSGRHEEHVWDWHMKDELGHPVTVWLSKYGRIHSTTRCPPRALAVDIDLDPREALQYANAIQEAVRRSVELARTPGTDLAAPPAVAELPPPLSGLTTAEADGLIESVRADHPEG